MMPKNPTPLWKDPFLVGMAAMLVLWISLIIYQNFV